MSLFFTRNIKKLLKTMLSPFSGPNEEEQKDYRRTGTVGWPSDSAENSFPPALFPSPRLHDYTCVCVCVWETKATLTVTLVDMCPA
jgi:hypothetical protein